MSLRETKQPIDVDSDVDNSSVSSDHNYGAARPFRSFAAAKLDADREHERRKREMSNNDGSNQSLDELSSSSCSSSFALSNSSTLSVSLLGKKRKSSCRNHIASGMLDESLVDPAPLDGSSSSSSYFSRKNSCRGANAFDPEKHVTRAYLARVVKKNTEYHEKEISVLRYENEILKANLRQYRLKARKVRRIVNATIDRDDMLMEAGNANLEQQPPIVLEGEIKSDREDNFVRNAVRYSYGNHSESDS